MQKFLYLLFILFIAVCGFGQNNWNIEKLKHWGTKKYTCHKLLKGKKYKEGTVVFNTKFVDDRIILEDNWDFSNEEFRLRIMTTSLKDRLLTPKKMEYLGEGRGKFEVLGSLKNDIFTMHMDDGRIKDKQEYNWHKKTLTYTTFFRIVTLLPQTSGFEVSFPFLLNNSMKMVKNIKIRYLNMESININNVNVKCAVFAANASSRHPIFRFPLFAWVSTKGILRRFVMGKYEFSISLESDVESDRFLILQLQKEIKSLKERVSVLEKKIKSKK